MAGQLVKQEKFIHAKPILKWAGGKTQMLDDIMPKIPGFSLQIFTRFHPVLKQHFQSY